MDFFYLVFKVYTNHGDIRQILNILSMELARPVNMLLVCEGIDGLGGICLFIKNKKKEQKNAANQIKK